MFLNNWAFFPETKTVKCFHQHLPRIHQLPPISLGSAHQSPWDIRYKSRRPARSSQISPGPESWRRVMTVMRPVGTPINERKGMGNWGVMTPFRHGPSEKSQHSLQFHLFQVKKSQKSLLSTTHPTHMTFPAIFFFKKNPPRKSWLLGLYLKMWDHHIVRTKAQCKVADRTLRWSSERPSGRRNAHRVRNYTLERAILEGFGRYNYMKVGCSTVNAAVKISSSQGNGPLKMVCVSVSTMFWSENVEYTPQRYPNRVHEGLRGSVQRLELQEKMCTDQHKSTSNDEL